MYQHITRYNLSFNDYERIKVHTEYVVNEHIINFNVDQEAQKILFLSKIPKMTPGHNFKFTLIDLCSNKVVFEQMISNPELLGRLESGLFQFIGGHLYYNNNVIKIRYDLIDSPNSEEFTELEIFDYYRDIFDLNDKEKI